MNKAILCAVLLLAFWQWPQPHYPKPKTKPTPVPAPKPTPGRMKCTAYDEGGKTRWRCVDIATGKPVEGEG